MKKHIALTIKEFLLEQNKNLSEIDIFDIEDFTKLPSIISKHLRCKAFSNNADWGSADVWNINGGDNFVGTFLYIGDDECLILKRELIEDEYNDEIIKNIKTLQELYDSLIEINNNNSQELYNELSRLNSYEKW